MWRFSVRTFVRPYVPPSGPQARPEAQPATPEPQPARPEAQTASQPASLRLQGWLAGPQAWLAVPQAWLAGPQAWLAGPQAWLAGLDSPEGGRTYRYTNVRMDRKSPHSTKLCPLSGQLPKNGRGSWSIVYIGGSQSERSEFPLKVKASD